MNLMCKALLSGALCSLAGVSGTAMAQTPVEAVPHATAPERLQADVANRNSAAALAGDPVAKESTDRDLATRMLAEKRFANRRVEGRNASPSGLDYVVLASLADASSLLSLSQYSSSANRFAAEHRESSAATDSHGGG